MHIRLRDALMPKLPRLLVVASLLALPAGGAWAQDGWTTVVRDSDRQVQIDRNSIIQSDAGTKVAWARLVLTPAEAAASGYVTVQALNRYDCRNRSFVTVKRRYFDARNIVVREEGVAPQRPASVARNGVDDRLWREVCQPPSLGDLEKLMIEADRVAAVVGAGAGVEEAVAVPVGEVHAREEAAPSPAPAPLVETSKPPPAAVPPTALGERDRPSPAPRESSRGSAAPQWGYHGKNGPASWGDLRGEWSQCRDGQRQSPIDIRGGVAVDLEPVIFDYRPTPFRVTDTGLMLQVHVGAGMSARIRGVTYELVFFRLHRPAQERIEGRVYEMSAHFHHRAADGRMAVVAVMLAGANEPHPGLQALLNNLPLEPGDDYAPATTLDLSAMLPASPAHYLYTGSLTTPPCTEGVMQVVMKEPVAVAWEQISVFRRLHPDNNRPVQESGTRLILESR